MNEEDFKKLVEKMQSNELYRASKSVHKDYQYRQFSDPATGMHIDGQQVRKEDRNGLVPEQDGYDRSSERIVIYQFKDGVLNSENDEPAVQYEGHYEIWNMGLLAKVWADGGDTVELWKDGVPYSIETGLSKNN